MYVKNLGFIFFSFTPHKLITSILLKKKVIVRNVQWAP